MSLIEKGISKELVTGSNSRFLSYVEVDLKDTYVSQVRAKLCGYGGYPEVLGIIEVLEIQGRVIEVLPAWQFFLEGGERGALPGGC